MHDASLRQCYFIGTLYKMLPRCNKKLCIFWRLKSQDDTIHILTSIGELRVFSLENWLTKRNSTVVINISINGIIHAKKDERSESL